jgi:hypothetical protein
VLEFAGCVAPSRPTECEMPEVGIDQRERYMGHWACRDGTMQQVVGTFELELTAGMSNCAVGVVVACLESGPIQ